MTRPLLELIVGVKRDPNFGHLIAVGTGGVLAELISDSKVALVDALDEGKAIEMLSSTAAGKALISGRFKDRDGASRLALAVVGVAEFVTLHPEISELDINPLAITKEYEVVALDSLVVAKAGGIS
jgi:succinyl-CoA synthetase beta subunit